MDIVCPESFDTQLQSFVDDLVNRSVAAIVRATFTSDLT